MVEKINRVYTSYTKIAISVFAGLIKHGRKTKKWTEKELAERAGISRATLQKIEKGELSCEIGLFFEVAALVGVPLFEADLHKLKMDNDFIQGKLALLPQSVRKAKQDVDNDF